MTSPSRAFRYGDNFLTRLRDGWSFNGRGRPTPSTIDSDDSRNSDSGDDGDSNRDRDRDTPDTPIQSCTSINNLCEQCSPLFDQLNSARVLPVEHLICDPDICPVVFSLEFDVQGEDISEDLARIDRELHSGFSHPTKLYRAVKPVSPDRRKMKVSYMVDFRETVTVIEGQDMEDIFLGDTVDVRRWRVQMMKPGACPSYARLVFFDQNKGDVIVRPESWMAIGLSFAFSNGPVAQDG
ncbi:hypothetical protein BDW62DRAFT_197290 [Aspergillus aurantiobrunneus]